MEERRVCRSCHIQKPISEFESQRSRAGEIRWWRRQCRTCRHDAHRLRYEKDARAFIVRTVSSLRSGRRRRSPDVEFKITPDDVLRIFHEQRGLCALSAIPLTWRRRQPRGNNTNISIDRIDVGGDYTPANIHLICADLNWMRGTRTIEDFKRWCKEVAKHG